MKFRFLDHVGEAAFEAHGRTERELFENAALALFEIMADTKKLKTVKSRTFGLKAKTLEELLHRFLSELVFLKDAKRRLFQKVKVRVKKEKTGFSLLAKASGEEIEKIPRARIRTDVKAVTWNAFGIRQTGKQLKARVVLDI